MLNLEALSYPLNKALTTDPLKQILPFTQLAHLTNHTQTTQRDAEVQTFTYLERKKKNKHVFPPLRVEAAE